MSGYRILVVDDDPAQRDLLEGSLQLAGYSVLRAAGGEEAFEHIAAGVPDLMLLDVQMPEMDGLEVLRRLRARPETRDVPVLLLSSLNRSNVRVRGLELGADDYISKSCEQAELLARVRAGLRRAQRYRSAEHALSGNLDDMGLEILLQTLQIGAKTGRVDLQDTGAVLSLSAGAIRSCSYLRFEGAPALERVFLMARGRFVVSLERTNGDAASAGDATRGLSLVAAVVAVDEARQALGVLAAGNPLLAIDPSAVAHPSIEKLRSSFPVTVLELIVAMQGTIGENAEIVVRALLDGPLVAHN